MISERSVDISRPFHLHINDPGGTSTYSARSPDHYPLFHQLISCRHSFLCPCQDPGSGHYTSGLSAIDCHNCFRYFFFLPYPRTWHINPLLPSHEPLTILLSTTQGSLRPIHSLFIRLANTPVSPFFQYTVVSELGRQSFVSSFPRCLRTRSVKRRQDGVVKLLQGKEA